MDVLTPETDARCALVLLTHDRRDEIARAVERARALPERPELVVVDNASRDGTSEALRARWPDLRIVRSAVNLGAAGRNLGVDATERPYVAFADDDTAWEPGALRRAADLLDADPRLAVVSALVRIGDDGRVDPTCLAMGSSPLCTVPGAALLPIVGFLSGACMFRRSAFLAAGGYEPRLFIGSEEALLSMDLLAAGWALAYAPSVVVWHWPSAQRDAALRRLLLARNAVKIAWLRRPWRHALALTVRHGVRAARAGDGLALARDLVRALPWLARARRPVPAGVEHLLRTVERARHDLGA